MDFEQALTAELSAIPGLESKVFPIVAPQVTAGPYLTYTLENNERVQSLTGHDGLVQSRYQLDLFHASYAGLKALKKAVIQNLKTLNLRNIGGTGPYIQQVEILSELEAYEESVKLYKGIIEFDVHYNE
jgi:hypothetical protein